LLGSLLEGGRRLQRRQHMTAANVVLGLAFAALTLGVIFAMLNDRRRG
jgi:hypothetical protein